MSDFPRLWRDKAVDDLWADTIGPKMGLQPKSVKDLSRMCNWAEQSFSSAQPRLDLKMIEFSLDHNFGRVVRLICICSLQSHSYGT